MFPAQPGNTYIPGFSESPPELTIEDVRRYGQIALISEDGTQAAVQVVMPDSLVISFVGVTLNEKGEIQDFVRKKINRYVMMKPQEPEKKSS